ncbi:MAG: cytochrome c, partial [Bacteroidota bacterium]
MKIGLPVTMLLLCCLFSQAQTPNWSEHIAPIVYTNCSNCHREGGIAPFALMSYEEASNASFYLANSVSERRMPPWPPSPTYSSFAHERVLTSQEIELI